MKINPKNTDIRLARLEAICNQLRAEMDDVLNNAYQKAVEEKDEISAAELARKIRNKLLEASDKECTFDRLLPEAPTGKSFTDWIGWLSQLSAVSTNAWGIYRQQLRDITKQEGFPFDIKFPTPPSDD